MKTSVCLAVLLAACSSVSAQKLQAKGGEDVPSQNRSPLPANDECSGAIFLPCNSTVQANLTLATTNNADPFFSCATFGPRPGSGTLWYYFVAGATTATLTTSNVNAPSPDTLLTAYSGACGTLTEIGCDDDIDEGNLLSKINLTGLTPGEVYYVKIGAFDPSGLGTYGLTYTAPPPVNDNCVNAIALSCNSYVQADLASATSVAGDPLFPCTQFLEGYNSVWYTFTPAGTTARLFTSPVTGGAANDTLLAVYVGSCNNLVQIACNDDADGTDYSDINLVGLTPGNTYYVQLAAYYVGAEGSYGLNLECPNECVTCPSGAYIEQEACGTDANGGCNSTPPAYETIPCGQTMCGTWYARNGSRDTDWLEFNLQERAFVQLCGVAQVDYQLALIDTNCPVGQVYSNNDFLACAQGCFGVALNPGNYIVFMAPEFSTGSFTCTDLGNWTVQMTITPACPGDMNNDGKVNTVDLAILLRSFGQSASTCYVADSDHNGVINTVDLADLLRHFGATCAVERVTEPFPADTSLFSSIRPPEPAR